MITRIVKLTIDPNRMDDFIDSFNQHKNEIKSFEGCNHLELLAKVNEDGIVFTYSKWNAESDLENYRASELFKGIWSYVKPMFIGKPEAWSTVSKFEV